MKTELMDVLQQFALDADPISCSPYGCGHINVTYLAQTASGRRYILQKINDRTFHDIPALMHNIVLVTEHLQRKVQPPMQALQLVRTLNGGAYLEHSGFWRVYDFVENSLCLQQPESDRDFYEAASGFGAFRQMLTDFPAEQLHETIPNFHNTPLRLAALREKAAENPMHRAGVVTAEIDFALSRADEMGKIQALLDAGALPLCVTHNDTKLNNVLFDAATRHALCVIDLDTVMPGTSLFDFGDAIRFGAATAAEDVTDLSRMRLSLDRFRAFTKGYLTACPGMSAQELELLPLASKIMTIECGARFLTDHLDGDHYFSIHRSGHNLDRCRTQFKLAADMEQHWDEMHAIVQEEAAKLRY